MNARIPTPGQGVMEGFPPPGERRITAANWQEPEFLRWSLMHRCEQVGTVPIWRGDGPVSPLPDSPEPLDELLVPGLDGTPVPLGRMLVALEADAFLVLHRGKVVYE